MANNEADSNLLEVTSKIVAAHVSNNAVSAADLPELINGVHTALAKLGQAAAPASPPAVPISDSVRSDYIVCLEDGKRLKTLKRHLRAAFDMSPEEYRAKWNLPADYPMVAESYSAQRRNLAKRIGLGRKSGRRARASARAPS